jgi:p-aminobenzoyl-glutamate transporter AbgT
MAFYQVMWWVFIAYVGEAILKNWQFTVLISVILTFGVLIIYVIIEPRLSIRLQINRDSSAVCSEYRNKWGKYKQYGLQSSLEKAVELKAKGKCSQAISIWD